AVIGIPLLQGPIALHVDDISDHIFAATENGIDRAVFAGWQSTRFQRGHNVLRRKFLPHSRQMFLGSFWNTHANESIVSGRTADVATAPRTAGRSGSGLSRDAFDGRNCRVKLSPARLQIG